MARTAAIVGTATVVSNAVSRRQHGRWAAQDQARTPDAADVVEGSTSDMLDQLRQLGELRTQENAPLD
jgi:hypothetical protein